MGVVPLESRFFAFMRTVPIALTIGKSRITDNVLQACTTTDLLVRFLRPRFQRSKYDLPSARADIHRGGVLRMVLNWLIGAAGLCLQRNLPRV